MKENMLFSGESKNIEYKVTVPDKSEKYMKTVVAFANGKGGKIVFGVDDKTLEIVGMNTENIYKTMDAITTPFLIGVNQPTNRMLLYRKVKIKRGLL